MKTTILTILLFSLVTVAAQTNQILPTANGGTGYWVQVATNSAGGGAVFIYRTNNLPVSPAAIPVIAPIEIETWANTIQNIITGALALFGLIATAYAKWKHTQASVVPSLVKAVESFGSAELKGQIEQAALRAGVEPALSKAVEANTASKPEPVPPPKPVTPP